MATRLTSMRSVSLLTAASAVTLAIQFGYQLLLARYFGSSTEMDAYGAALTPPTVVSGLLMGSVGYAFLPRFIESCRQDGDEAGWRLAASVGWSLVIVMAALSIAAVLAAPRLMALLYPGFSAADVVLSARLFRWLAWLALFNSAIGFLQALHHARQSFLVPALASIVGVAFTLVWTWFRAASGGIGAVVEGVVCGSAVAVAIQAPLFLRNCHWRITWNERLARTLVLAAPLLLGGVFKFEPQLDRYFASGMGTGVIAQLGYSKALVQAFLVLTVSSLSTVLFPVVARLAGERRHDELRRELERSLQLLALLLIPLSVGLLVLGEPFVAMLLERGEFTPDDSRVVTQLLILQIGVIVGGSLGEIFSKVYYALADTRTPVMIGLMGFALGIGLKFLWQAKYGADGLVTATSVYLVVTALVMGIVLVRSTGLFVTRHLLLTLGRAATAALLAGFVAHMVWSHAGRFAVVWAGLSGATIYALGLILLREPLAAEIRHVARLWRRPELSAADNALLAADPAGDIAPHTSGDAVSDGRMLGS